MKQRTIIIIFISMIIPLWNAYAAQHRISNFKETPLGSYQNVNQIGGFSELKELPEILSLKLSEAKDQGPLGACVSFAVSACTEYYHKKLFSEAEFTILAQTSEDSGNKCIDGLPSLGKTIGVAKDKGLVEENCFPYNIYLRKVAEKNGTDVKGLYEKENIIVCNDGDYLGTMNEMGIELSPDIERFQIQSMYAIRHFSRRSLFEFIIINDGKEPIRQELGSIGVVPFTIEEMTNDTTVFSIKKALYMGFPVAVALMVYKDCWSNKALLENSCFIQKPKLDRRKEDGYFEGYHAVVITGYNDEDQTFTIKNSWGKDWGDKGFAYIPYDYISAYSTELVAASNH